MTKEIEKYLEKIIVSPEFENSTKYPKLLKYLVKSSLEGNIPKEVTIAYEVYNVEIDESSPLESNIRVYIYNLRKKLDSYYVSEGKDDKIRFVIPKGRYKVEFIPKKESEKIKMQRWLKLSVGFVALLILSQVFFAGFYFKEKKKEKFTKSLKYVWDDFLSDEYPVQVVLGDYYLIKNQEYPERVRYIRDVTINSDNDYKSFIDKYPHEAENTHKTKHTLFGKFAPVCINELNKIFASNNKNLDIVMGSDFQWHNVQENNIVYIGSFKSLGIFKELLVNSNFKFVVYPNELEYHHLSSDSVFHYYSTDSDINHAYETDYTIVTKFPITDKTNILFFISTRDIGLIAAVKYFTNPKLVNEFKNQFENVNSESFYFESCFKVQGLHRNTIDVKLLHTNSFNTRPFLDLSTK